MSELIDFIVLLFTYLLVGILFAKAYKIYFHNSYNYLKYDFSERKEDNEEYNKNKYYPETTGTLWLVIIVYPFLILWIIITRPFKFLNYIAKKFLD